MLLYPHPPPVLSCLCKFLQSPWNSFMVSDSSLEFKQELTSPLPPTHWFCFYGAVTLTTLSLSFALGLEIGSTCTSWANLPPSCLSVSILPDKARGQAFKDNRCSGSLWGTIPIFDLCVLFNPALPARHDGFVLHLLESKSAIILSPLWHLTVGDWLWIMRLRDVILPQLQQRPFIYNGSQFLLVHLLPQLLQLSCNAVYISKANMLVGFDFPCMPY